MADQGICAVIPAAGRGSRLGRDVPKIMVEIVDGVTVWDVLYGRLAPLVDHVHVVMSPAGAPLLSAHAAEAIAAGAVSVSVQAEPTGMGGAVFGAEQAWREYRTILVVWGDQANLSAQTVARTLAIHEGGLSLPLVPMDTPYVEYRLDGGRLTHVLQSREGDATGSGGLSDVGVFGLPTAGLADDWRSYLAEASPGALTGEVNFLPFLPYLSNVRGRNVRVVPVTDPEEARGINTQEDLAAVRKAFRR